MDIRAARSISRPRRYPRQIAPDKNGNINGILLHKAPLLFPEEEYLVKSLPTPTAQTTLNSESDSETKTLRTKDLIRFRESSVAHAGIKGAIEGKVENGGRVS